MKETSVVVPEEIPAIGLNYVVELPGKKQISFQTHVPQTMGLKEINEIVDKCRDAAARQYWHELVDVLAQDYENQKRIGIEHHNRMVIAETNFKEGWARRGKKGEPQMTDTERQQKMQAENHMAAQKEIIAKSKKKLLEAYQKAGMEPPTDLD